MCRRELYNTHNCGPSPWRARRVGVSYTTHTSTECSLQKFIRSLPPIAPTRGGGGGGGDHIMALVLATLAASATLRLVVHRDEPKLTNPNGPCSTMLEVSPTIDVAEAVSLASARLDAPIVMLVTSAGTAVTSLAGLANDTTVSALEIKQAESVTRRELAAAYRLFHMYGLAPYDGESINFISVRIPGTDEFLINDYTLLWEEVTATSFLKIPIDEAARTGAAQGQPGHRNPRLNEASLDGSTAIFQMRPDAQCFLHSHTLPTATVASLEDGLRPLSQAGIMLANMVSLSHFDFFQPGNETVAAMAGKKVMLQKWHGMFIAGSSLGECFYLALSIDRACQAQQAILSSGVPHYSPTADEVRRWSQAYVDDPFYGGYDGDRIWPAMVRKVERLQPDYKT